MCHDIQTTDKFCATNLTAKQAMEHRKLFEKALEGPEMTPSKPQTSDNQKRPATKAAQPRKRILQVSSSSEMTSCSTTSPEASVMYQESGVSIVDSDQDDAKEKFEGSTSPTTVEGKAVAAGGDDTWGEKPTGHQTVGDDKKKSWSVGLKK